MTYTILGQRIHILVKQRQVVILDSDRLSFVFTGHTVCLSRKVMGIAEDSSKQGDFGGNEKEPP